MSRNNFSNVVRGNCDEIVRKISRLNPVIAKSYSIILPWSLKCFGVQIPGGNVALARQEDTVFIA